MATECTFTKSVTDGRRTKLIYFFFLKKKAGIIANTGRYGV